MGKINIAELLKDCPKGMELDCTMFNDNCMEFNDIVDNKFLPIRCRVKQSNGEYNFYNFTKYGCWIDDDKAKCVIFPKGKTTWEVFQRPFKDGDILATNDGKFIAIIKKNGGKYYCCCHINNGYFETDYSGWFDRLATEKEKQILFDAIKANGYCWNSETKILEKLINKHKFVVGETITNGIITGKIISRDIDSYKLEDGNYVFFNEVNNFKLVHNKFDVTTLKAFESRVLVRNDENQRWLPAFWGYKVVDGFITTFGWCKYCIPYEGNEFLFKTNNDCDDYFKTWEK